MATIRLYLGWNFEDADGASRLYAYYGSGRFSGYRYWLLDDRTRIERATDGRLYYSPDEFDAFIPPNVEPFIAEVSLRDNYVKGIREGRYEQCGVVAHVDESGSLRAQGSDKERVLCLYRAILAGRLEPVVGSEE